ncbi:MAG: DUF2292 domain-containing protein [Nitrospirae bacterium]|nr:MAG: DUF2292 domain-containing protein [Nitrospirota bacterium]
MSRSNGTHKTAEKKVDEKLCKMLVRMIREKPYQTITIKVHEGRVVRILREESIKIEDTER